MNVEFCILTALNTVQFWDSIWKFPFSFRSTEFNKVFQSDGKRRQNVRMESHTNEINQISQVEKLLAGWETEREKRSISSGRFQLIIILFRPICLPCMNICRCVFRSVIGYRLKSATCTPTHLTWNTWKKWGEQLLYTHIKMVGRQLGFFRFVTCASHRLVLLFFHSLFVAFVNVCMCYVCAWISKRML